MFLEVGVVIRTQRGPDVLEIAAVDGLAEELFLLDDGVLVVEHFF